MKGDDLFQDKFRIHALTDSPNPINMCNKSKNNIIRGNKGELMW